MLTATASPDTWETAGLVASAVSTALAFFAIWQAITFYRWSDEASKDSRRAADAVGESVRKLEDLFNRLYTDTFGMMRDTVSDMRKHVWPSGDRSDDRSRDEALEEVERRANENVGRVRDEVMREVRDLVETIGATTTQVASLEESLSTVLDRAISGSREAAEEAKEETVRSRMRNRINLLRGRDQTEVDADSILAPLFDDFDPQLIHRTLFELRDEGVVDFEGELPWVSGPQVPVKIRRRKRTPPQTTD